jgi:hypothetical protein
MLAGSGKASVATRSKSVRPSTSSSSRAAVASMAGIMAVTRFSGSNDSSTGQPGTAVVVIAHLLGVSASAA